MKCPKCGGEMEKGLIADQGYLIAIKSSWGSELRMGGILNFGLENKKEITTFRCKSCGYLESYAK